MEHLGIHKKQLLTPTVKKKGFISPGGRGGPGSVGCGLRIKERVLFLLNLFSTLKNCSLFPLKVFWKWRHKLLKWCCDLGNISFL